MPTVPWRTSTNLTGMELQSVDQEETIVENEVAYDQILMPTFYKFKFFNTFNNLFAF